MERSSDDIIVSLLVAGLLEKLSSQALRDFGSVWGVKSELNKLSDVLENIQGSLYFAERAQTKNHLVKRCLRNLRDVAYRAEYILDAFIFEACRKKDTRYSWRNVNEVRSFLFNLNGIGILRKECISPLINNKLRKELEEIQKKLEIYYCRGSEIWQSHGVNDEIDTRPKSGSRVDESVIFGRNNELNEIKNKLLSDPNESKNQVSVIAIVGFGGVGKTTLAQLVYNDPDVKKHFEEGRAWVCVSTDFDAVRLTSSILESLNSRNLSLRNLEPLQRMLGDELKEKRCLIILDDVWTENNNDWEVLRVAFMEAGKGSRIIVTTRSRGVSSMMHPIYTHDLQMLSDEDCWSIIKRHTSIHHGSIAPSLEAVGRNIARKCKGLPLAASTLAGLLHSSSNLKHWQSVMNSRMWELKKSNLPSALSVSYYFLPTYLKQCFAYCSVFPKCYKFDKQHLIQLWMAEGFIRSNTRMKDEGCEYFDDLLDRSFFQHDNEDKDKFVMHDLVHDLAQAMSGEVYGRFERVESNCISDKIRHLSMSCWECMSEDEKKHLERLYTLIHLNQCDIHVQRGGYFIGYFREMRYLRVLDLNNSLISELPDDIGDLKCLHYINLSYAPNIHDLPESLCDLHNLQSLILCHSGIHRLPRGMKYLCNLHHLDLHGCNDLLSMPQGIGSLSGLKTLSRFPVSEDDDGRGIRELKKLQQLEGLLEICSLKNVVDPEDAREADLMNKTKVDELVLSWLRNGDRDAEVFEGLQPHNELKILQINCYYGLTFPRWLTTDLPSYDKLVSLKLSSCWKCRVLPPIGELPLLEYLCIDNMNELEEWSSRREETGFPSLLSLTIEACPKLRLLPQSLVSSPILGKMRILYCPMLRLLLPHEGLRRLTCLKDLHLGYGVEGLVQSLDETQTLPPNLNRLHINYTSLPTGLRDLASLKHLTLGRFSHPRYSPEELPTNVVVTREW